MEKPAKRNAARTKAQILKAALGEFSEFGYQGARIDAIAKRANINKQMLYHYFGNKDDLFQSVLEQSYEKIRRHEAELKLADLDPIEAIQELVKFGFSYHSKNPEFMRLLNSENLQRAVHIKKSDKIRHMHKPLVEIIASVLKRGEADGVFRSNIDPVQFYITLVGVTYFYLSNIHTLSAIFDQDMMTKSAIKERQDHCEEAVLRLVRCQ